MPNDMPELPVDLNALIGSRICHDFISPLGAIGNGVELLAMAGTSPELALITESVANANARIRFFRVAFGTATADQRIGRPEVVSILADLYRGGRLGVDWQAEGDQSRREVKLAFLGLLCLETAMPYGGRITVANGPEGWQITGTANRFKIDPDLWQLLGTADGGRPPGAAQVQFALMPIEATRQKRKIAVTIDETAIRLGF